MEWSVTVNHRTYAQFLERNDAEDWAEREGKRIHKARASDIVVLHGPDGYTRTVYPEKVYVRRFGLVSADDEEEDDCGL